MHTMEEIIETKYGPRKVIGAWAVYYRQLARRAQVIADVEREIEEMQAKKMLNLAKEEY